MELKETKTSALKFSKLLERFRASLKTDVIGNIIVCLDGNETIAVCIYSNDTCDYTYHINNEYIGFLI